MIALCAVISIIINLAGIFIYHSVTALRNDEALTEVVVNATPANPWAEVAARAYAASVSFYCEASIGAWSGSGIIVSPDGYILTNDHVAGDSTIRRMDVTLSNGDKYSATLVTSDPSNDCALVKIDATDLTWVKIGNSESVNPGDAVIAIGNSLGDFPDSVAEGVIAHTNRNFKYWDSKQHLFQTTAAGSSGNSGGGIVNYRGELIALFSAKRHSFTNLDTGLVEDAENIGFAVPINYPVAMIEKGAPDLSISADGTLGIKGKVITSKETRRSRIYSSEGVYIDSLEHFGAGYFAELQVNDRVLRVNGKNISSPENIDSAISDVDIGMPVKVEIVRGGVLYIYQIEVMRKY